MRGNELGECETARQFGFRNNGVCDVAGQKRVHDRETDARC